MTNNNPMIQVTNDLGITFNVRISYSDGEVLKDKDKMLVTFYDTRYKHTEYGQQVFGAYYASTLLGKDGFISNKSIKDTGLNLYGGEPQWYITAENSNKVVEFLEEHYIDGR